MDGHDCKGGSSLLLWGFVSIQLTFSLAAYPLTPDAMKELESGWMVGLVHS